MTTLPTSISISATVNPRDVAMVTVSMAYLRANQAVFKRDCDQSEQSVLIAPSPPRPVADLRHVSPDSCIMLLGNQRRPFEYCINLTAIFQHLPSTGKSRGNHKRIT